MTNNFSFNNKESTFSTHTENSNAGGISFCLNFLFSRLLHSRNYSTPGKYNSLPVSSKVFFENILVFN